MRRIRWRAGRARADIEHNERMAEALLNDPATDDYVVALDVVGFKIVAQSPALASERWPLLGRVPLVPDWAISVADQERDVRHAQRIAAEQRQPSDEYA